MVADAILFCHTKKSKKTSHDYICVVSKRKKDLTKIHDENDVLTDDELVVARDFLSNSKYACLYIRNKYPRGFCVK